MSPKNKDKASLVLTVEVSDATAQAAVVESLARHLNVSIPPGSYKPNALVDVTIPAGVRPLARGDQFDSFDILETILAAYGEALLLTEGGSR